MVFMSHWLFTKLHIVENAPAEMQQQLFPLLQNGKATLSVAISEPKAGAHPKHLQTTAIKEDDFFVLNGEKSFLTNGPIASFYIVLAITDETEGRKAFSALLVPAETQGLQKTKGVEIDFLHPCSHGGITLENCKIPAANLIGSQGDAYERTSLNMRAVEDAIGAAGQIGSLQRLLSDMVPHTLPQDAAIIGEISVQLKALHIIATALAKKAEETNLNMDSILEIHLGFRQLISPCIQTLNDLSRHLSNEIPPETILLARDISKFQSIAGNAHKTRFTKLGLQIQES